MSHRGVDLIVHGPTDVDRGSPMARFFDGDVPPVYGRPDLENGDFRLPPFAEQRRIVRVIEEQFSRLDDVKTRTRECSASRLALTRAATRRAFIDQCTRGTLVASSQTEYDGGPYLLRDPYAQAARGRRGALRPRSRLLPGTRWSCRAYGEPRLRSRESTSARHCRPGDVLVSIRAVRPRRVCPDELAGANITAGNTLASSERCC